MAKVLLETRDLTIGYRNEKEDKLLGVELNLKLSKGSFVALLGPNGSGKSTLIRSISGLLETLKGQVMINGKLLSEYTNTQRAKNISIVLTTSITSPGLLVFDVVAYGRFPYTNWLGKLNHTDEQIIDESLALVDMLGFKYRKLNTLSDGERQRVMIAKALAQQSDIMILDEPTAHLDLINRVEIMKLLRKLAHTQKRAILISTHELDLAMQSADILWLMRADKKISVGAPEDLIINQSMQEVFAQSSVDFDHLSGMFKIKHQINSQMHFVSDDAQIALWTKKAMEKIGIALSEDINNENTIHYLAAQAIWKVKINGVEGQFSSLADLVEFVSSTNI